jgi:hypothetical protein
MRTSSLFSSSSSWSTHTSLSLHLTVQENLSRYPGRCKTPQRNTNQGQRCALAVTTDPNRVYIRTYTAPLALDDPAFLSSPSSSPPANNTHTSSPHPRVSLYLTPFLLVLSSSVGELASRDLARIRRRWLLIPFSRARVQQKPLALFGFAASDDRGRMGRPPCCDKDGVKKGPWTPEEDLVLVSYIQEHGPGNWRAVPTRTGTPPFPSCQFRISKSMASTRCVSI